MTSLTLIGIAFGLAMDAFAVSIGVSATLKEVKWVQLLRLSILFGFFQALMPVLGWVAGLSVASYIERFDHWVAFILLAIIGGKMIYSGIKGDEEIDASKDPTRGLTALVLSIATSIDAMAVGLSFAMLGVVIWLPALIIGLVAFAMTAIGMKVGGMLGGKFGNRMEIIGGLVLIAIGIKIVIEHLS